MIVYRYVWLNTYLLHLCKDGYKLISISKCIKYVFFSSIALPNREFDDDLNTLLILLSKLNELSIIKTFYGNVISVAQLRPLRRNRRWLPQVWVGLQGIFLTFRDGQAHANRWTWRSLLSRLYLKQPTGVKLQLWSEIGNSHPRICLSKVSSMDQTPLTWLFVCSPSIYQEMTPLNYKW